MTDIEAQSSLNGGSAKRLGKKMQKLTERLRWARRGVPHQCASKRLFEFWQDGEEIADYAIVRDLED
ncbi:MAG: hypothetical protein AB7P20_22120, partial [Rhizobiaceae bacterium]